MRTASAFMSALLLLASVVSCVDQIAETRNDCFDVRVKRGNFGATTSYWITIDVESKCPSDAFSGVLVDLEDYTAADVDFLDSFTLLVSTGYTTDYNSVIREPTDFFVTNLNNDDLKKVSVEAGYSINPFDRDTITYVTDSIPPFELSLSQTRIDTDARFIRLKTLGAKTKSILIRPVDSLRIEKVSELPFRVAVKWKGSNEEQVLLITPPKDDKPMEISIE
jgi:hypothetical protein